MIGYIVGEVTGIYNEYIILENNGIGYRIFTSGKAMTEISGNAGQIKFFTYLHVREDEMTLYGFPTAEELDTFKLLITVNGIGPKAGLAILSAMSVKELYMAIMMSDAKSITKANGVGLKGANRIIMELKDKLNFEDTLSLDNNDEINGDLLNTEMNMQSSEMSDAILALVSLGYSEADAVKAVKSIKDVKNLPSGKIIKEALKKL